MCWDIVITKPSSNAVPKPRSPFNADFRGYTQAATEPTSEPDFHKMKAAHSKPLARIDTKVERLQCMQCLSQPKPKQESAEGRWDGRWIQWAIRAYRFREVAWRSWRGVGRSCRHCTSRVGTRCVSMLARLGCRREDRQMGQGRREWHSRSLISDMSWRHVMVAFLYPFYHQDPFGDIKLMNASVTGACLPPLGLALIYKRKYRVIRFNTSVMKVQLKCYHLLLQGSQDSWCEFIALCSKFDLASKSTNSVNDGPQLYLVLVHLYRKILQILLRSFHLVGIFFYHQVWRGRRIFIFRNRDGI